MNEENLEIVCDSPVLSAAVDDVIQMFKNQEEEVQKLEQKKCDLEAEIDHLKKVSQFLELEKAELDGVIQEQEMERLSTDVKLLFAEDIMKLKLRNLAYQKEHSNLRNSITVVKFQIEKIKDSIAVAKANDLKGLEDFEKAVDEITEKFRSGPAIYDRKILVEKVEREKEKRDSLVKKLEGVRESYDDFNNANGLRGRTDKSEQLLSCVLPGSLLSCFIEMTKTLDEVISGMRNLTGGPKEGGEKFP